MKANKTLTVLVPGGLPPTVNHMYGHGYHGRRYLTRKAKNFRYRVILALMDMRAPRVSGEYEVEIFLPRGRGDADNRVKATLDALVQSGRVADDRYCRRVAASWCDEEDVRIVISWSDDDEG